MCFLTVWESWRVWKIYRPRSDDDESKYTYTAPTQHQIQGPRSSLQIKGVRETRLQVFGFNTASKMSLHLPPPADFSNQDGNSESDCASSESDDEDQTWDDWVSDSLIQQPCRSLFEDKTFPSVEETLLHDRHAHGFDLSNFCSALCSYRSPAPALP